MVTISRSSKIFVAFLTLVLSLSYWAYAQSKYSIKEMTPEVQAALDGRRARYDALKELKQKALVGENNQGYVEALTDEAQAADLVKSENIDRKVIYQTIAAQNNLGDAITTIETVFAQVQHDKAEAGDKIQDESGNWSAK
jgi:uncharacterized protein YdbL (DUF1318 family)